MTLNTTYNPTVADGNGTTKEFSYNFNPLAREYLKVSFQINNEWVEQKSGWSATVSENGGVVTFDIAPTTRVAIERDVPEEQPTQYKTSSGFQAEVIEHSFDLLTGMVQELKDETSRSVKVEVGSNISPDEIVAQVERVYDSIDNIDTVGMDIDNVDSVATNISKVNTIANNINDVKTVVDNINDVKTVSKNIENVNTVATDIMDVVTVAGITEQTKNVSDNMAHVVAVDNNKANIDKAVTNETNITTVADNINDIKTVKNNIDIIDNVAWNKSNINNVSVNMPFVEGVSENIEHVVAVDRNKANIDNVATNKTNINNVAENITAVNNVSENMADVKNAVQSANDAKLWAIGTIAEKPEGSSKYWAEQAQEAAQVYDATETVKGIVRLATSDEVTAGTNDSAAITPLKLKSKLDTKQDKSTAVNYNNISNCITEIPQDIKLELNNGALTLKAGSKVYVPNGFEADGTTEKFDVVIIDRNVSIPKWNNTVPGLISITSNREIWIALPEQHFSGNSAPTTQWALWYDTSNNKIKSSSDAGSTWKEGYCFPIAICTADSSKWTSIDQVFNGFGYIGSTVFALPGIKGRIPNGRNADGSLKSIEVVQNSVKIMTMASYMARRKHCPLELFSNNELGGMEINFYSWGTVATLKDLPRDKVYAAYYCLEDNFLHYFNNTGVESINKSLFAATFAVGDDNKITSFTPKTVFHALDYNDKSTISGWSMPSSRYSDLTLGASGSTYTAPANGYFFVSKKSTAATQEFVFENKSSGNFAASQDSVTANRTIRLTISAKKGDNIYIYYTLGGSTDNFRFIYAEGESYNLVSSSSTAGDTIDSADGSDDML